MSENFITATGKGKEMYPEGHTGSSHAGQQGKDLEDSEQRGTGDASAKVTTEGTG